MTDARILVVEDEKIVAKDLKQRLERLGYAVPAVAATGRDAVEKALDGNVDLVLMDIMLKGDMDGIQAAEQIRRRAGLPVVYLTAYSDRETLSRAKVTEAFGYILKPFEERELETNIEVALYKHAMERRIREREQWLSTTLRSIGDAVISTDSRGRVAFMNPVAEELTGRTQQEAEGQALNQVFRLVDERTLEPVDGYAAQILEHGGVRQLRAGDVLLVAKDGHRLPIDDSAAPIADEEGGVQGVVVVFRDVTERRTAEVRLRESEQRYRVLFNSIDDAAYLHGVKKDGMPGKFIEVNDVACRRLGYSRDELAKLTPANINDPESLAALPEVMAELHETRHVLFETVHVGRDGRRIPVEINAHLFELHDEPVVLSIARDISERKKAEAAMRIKDSAIASSISGIAIVGLDGRLTYANAAFLKMLGYRLEEEVLSRSVSQFWETQPKAIEAVRAVQKGRDWFGELVAIRQDGSRFDVQLAASAVVDEREKAVCMMVSCVDVSERKRVEKSLRELVRELNCLYAVFNVVEKPGLSLAEVLQKTVDLIPSAWRYPDAACARIVADGREYRTVNFAETPWTLSAPIGSDQRVIGRLEVGYVREQPEADQGPFLKEEQSLATAIADQLGYVIERKRTEEELKAAVVQLQDVLSRLA
ncbi:MAG: PAS domain S-box protein [Phycisphaerae bacterium]|nr:PAS domain S-box protein [Phycisphaerae bacterium]